LRMSASVDGLRLCGLLDDDAMRAPPPPPPPPADDAQRAVRASVVSLHARVSGVKGEWVCQGDGVCDGFRVLGFRVLGFRFDDISR